MKIDGEVCGISSNEVTLARSLVQNKRDDESLFICEGLWAAEKLIENKISVSLFLANNELLTANNKLTNKEQTLIAKMAGYAQKTCLISKKACEKISDREGCDDFFIVAKTPRYAFADIEKQFNGNNVLAIVLDGLEQPGNIGAVLRSFDCAGGDFAIIVNKKAKVTNSRVTRAALGASFMMPIVEATIEQAQLWLEKNGYKTLVTDLNAKFNYKEADYSGKIAIISGNEHTGISDSWRKLKHATSIIIPMLGSCESLNVGFASTLVAYEAGLQKFKNIKY